MGVLPGLILDVAALPCLRRSFSSSVLGYRIVLSFSASYVLFVVSLSNSAYDKFVSCKVSAMQAIYMM
jgi:hypothetical protein